MSQQPAAPGTEAGAALRALEIVQRIRRLESADPIAFYRPLPRFAAFHAADAKERWLIGGNRSGKSYALIAEAVLAVTGRAWWWKGKPPGEVWIVSAKISKSLEVLRPLFRQLCPPKLIRRWRHEHVERESETILEGGWTVRWRSCDQGRKAFESGACVLVLFDEEPIAQGDQPGAIFDECFARTMTTGGRVVVGFTPLNGIRWRDAHDRVYLPFRQLQDEAPGTVAANVDPDIHVSTAGMADNPHVPREEIERFRRRYSHRPLMLRVRLDGEWIDIAEEAIVDVSGLRVYHHDPPGAWRTGVIAIDPKYRKGQRAGTTAHGAIAVAGIADDPGKRYLIEMLSGEWNASEQLENCLRVIESWPEFRVFVQRVGGDSVFRDHLNDRLRMAGGRARVEVWPPPGERVPGKVERAQVFAPMVDDGQIHVRPEHVAFRQQAGAFSPGFERGGTPIDAFDAGMAALMLLDRVSRPIGIGDANRDAARGIIHQRFPQMPGDPPPRPAARAGAGFLGGRD